MSEDLELTEADVANVPFSVLPPPETKYYVSANGIYIGGYAGVEPPDAAIEVPTAPDDARQVWDFDTSSWGEIPPLTDYSLAADVPWLRMTDEEAELVSDAIDSSPVRTRQIINKATVFTTGTDAFIKFKAIISDALSSARASEIMGPPLPSEQSAVEGDTLS